MTIEYRTFAGKKYVLVASRSTKERALAAKARLTRIGTLTVRIVKFNPKVVGMSHYYHLWARPSAGTTLLMDRVPAAAERLM